MRKRAIDAMDRAGYSAVDRAGNPALSALVDYAAQGPGLEWCNYATSDYRESLRAYRREQREIGKDWAEVKKQLRLCWLLDIGDAEVIDASKGAFSGRMTWNGSEWNYCTGQYWPTEYRAAVAAVLKNAVYHAEWAKKNAQA